MTSNVFASKVPSVFMTFALYKNKLLYNLTTKKCQHKLMACAISMFK